MFATVTEVQTDLQQLAQLISRSLSIRSTPPRKDNEVKERKKGILKDKISIYRLFILLLHHIHVFKMLLIT